MSTETKFAQFITTKKLDPRRILAASHKLESLTLEDRVIKLGKRKPKEGEEAKAKTGEVQKPRSGRPVSQRAMDAAMKGGTVSGPTKSRMLRAVNYLLEKKKQEKVQLKTLF